MSEISEVVRIAARDGRLLLWICQRFDLAPNNEPHDSTQPAELIGSYYRAEPTEEDRLLASTFWEAAWIEGARSQFFHVYARLQREGAVSRPAVVFARAEDSGARILSSEFLAVSFVNGVLEGAQSADARYGFLPRRVRERAAWDLGGRLKLYPERTLVVLGAQTAGDVGLLRIVAEDNPLRGLRVILVQPGGEAIQALSDLPLEIEAYDGSLATLLSELAEAGARGAAESKGVRLRAGRTVLEIDPGVVERVSRRFVLLTEELITPVATLNRDHVLAFLDGDLSALPVFASGVLPVERDYTTDADKTLSLFDETLSARDRILAGDARFVLLRLPAEGGSGATTLIRKTAVDSAMRGLPSLMLKPGQVDVDIDELAAFLLAVNDACEYSGTEPPPVLLVLDAEHYGNVNTSLILRSLAVQGRRAVALEIMPVDPGDEVVVQRRAEWASLPLLSSVVGDTEAAACHSAITRLRDRFGLDFLPDITLDDWRRYQSSVWVRQPDGTAPVKSTFWVALRYFLLEGADFRTAQEVRGPLNAWIRKRKSQLVTEPSVILANTVAALSWFRLACPLSTALRVAYGGRYSTETYDALRSLSDLVQWNDRSEDLEDQTLMFRHPDVAQEYLAEDGVVSVPQAVGRLGQTLEALVDTPGDRLVAEELAATVLQRHARTRRDYDWRLEAFGRISPAIRETSRTILHHFGRLQYQAARDCDMPDDARGGLLKQSLRNLNRALEVEVDGRRQERPGLIYNTLGTAYWDYAEFLARSGASRDDLEEVWLKAARCFEKSINQLPDNIEALLAYSYRLLMRSGLWGKSDLLQYESEFEQAKGLGDALALLDEAKESLEDYVSPDPDWQTSLEEYRMTALTRLRSPEADELIESARTRGDFGLAEYLTARKILLVEEGEEGERRALGRLKEAFEAHTYSLGHRALGLLARLLRLLEPFEFELSRRVHEALDRDPGYVLTLIERFRYAVLCYQTGRYDDGAEQFRRLRAEVGEIQSSTPPHAAHDFLRSPGAPDSPVQITLRIQRIINPMRAYGYADELRQEIPVKPRQFPGNPGRGEIVRANVHFGMYGPYAVPPRRAKGPESN